MERKPLVSLVIAEELVDGKGTHRDEGDINAGKMVFAAAFSRNN